MTEATVLVTGATDGLGRAVALRLAADGVRLVLHGRDPERLAAVAAAACDVGAATPVTVVADLASLDEVRRLAAAVSNETDHLDVLLSNAGVGSGQPAGRSRAVSTDGYELRFAVNYLAGYLLTAELLPLLQASRQSRIVWVASLAQHALDFDDLMLERSYTGPRAYGQSKLAQVMSGFELAGRLDADRVTVNSLHPGSRMPTKIVLEEYGRSLDPIETGIEATCRLIQDRALDGVTGRFWDRATEASANEQAYDPEARARLWRVSEDLTGAKWPSV